MPEINGSDLIVSQLKTLGDQMAADKAARATADEAAKKALDERMTKTEATIAEVNAALKAAKRLSIPGLEVGAEQGKASWGRIIKIVGDPSLMKDPEYGVEAEIYRTMNERNDELVTTTKTALNAATGAAGGFLIPSEMMTALIPQLREVSQARKLGITVIDGLQGEVFWNKSKGGIVAEHLNTENEDTGTETVATFDQIRLSPHPIAAFVPLSFQMRNQPAMALEEWVRSEIATAIGLLEDKTIFVGTGANGSPRGVLYHPLINSVSFAGVAYTVAGQTVTDVLMNVVKKVRKKFALGLGNLGWATSPDVLYHFGKVKDTMRRPIFQSLTEGSAANNGAPLTIMRYPAIDSEFLDEDQRGVVGGTDTTETLIFGPWKDVVLAHWGTLALAMSEDTETNFRKGRTTIRGIWQYDVGVFHGDAFVSANVAGVGTIDTTASTA